MNEQVRLARELALINHEGQVDKAGQPYAGHLRRVAASVAHLGPEYEATGWLHDIVEDTAITPADLYEHGIHGYIVGAVVLLTADMTLTYSRRVGKVLASEIATAVKRADIADNMDRERLAALDEMTRARLLRKYRAGMDILDLRRMPT